MKASLSMVLAWRRLRKKTLDDDKKIYSNGKSSTDAVIAREMYEV